MSDNEALLAAVLASPADDLPRLVFADFLEESGHPAHAARAHYIRHQVEAARHPADSDVALAHARAAAAFRGAFRDEADDALGETARAIGVNVIRRRGFVDEIRAASRDLPACLGAFAVAPVRRLDLVVPADPFGRVGDGRPLGRLSELRLRFEYSALPDATDALLGCPWLTGLTTLDLSYDGLTSAWVLDFVRRFERAAFALSLRVLDLSRNYGITDTGASALAAARGLDGLTTLRVELCQLSGYGEQVLRARFGERVVV